MSHSTYWCVQAEVGDDVLGDDPTVKALEAAAAKEVGKEAALLVPSGTMGNLIAVLAHCSERGAEVIVGDESHVYVYEAGGMSVRAPGLPCIPARVRHAEEGWRLWWTAWPVSVSVSLHVSLQSWTVSIVSNELAVRPHCARITRNVVGMCLPHMVWYSTRKGCGMCF